ncbi:CD300 molecule like family member b [Rhinolophus ferrumequinum]|uniref:CD300 molecule like family member b n=1 Tax=Rhinolophus ferrumequinum TaxID=59479 RepID=A0A671ELF7_RHIFE|nr:CMRF35-like molecule 7 [Rhinolophus ferrumequinum]KAF6298224.1 CD300 molecule like family member b [Rhinolophus ferrumequinum]
MWLPPALLLLSLPGCFSIRGPASVRGREQGSLTVQCRYDPKWKNYVKWWCKGAVWSSCQILVKTTGSEWKKDRVSIRDNQRDHFITVTMKELRRDDQDIYWCGIQRQGTDLGVSIKVNIDPEGTVVTSSENLLSRTIANSHGGLSSGSNVRTHYVLLVFVKVPILLVLVGAILWLKGPPGVPKEQWEQPVYTHLSSDLTTDTVP